MQATQKRTWTTLELNPEPGNNSGLCHHCETNTSYFKCKFRHNGVITPQTAFLCIGYLGGFVFIVKDPDCVLCSVHSKRQTHDWVIGVPLFRDSQLREYVDWNLCIIREHACLSCLALFRWQAQLQIKGDTGGEGCLKSLQRRKQAQAVHEKAVMSEMLWQLQMMRLGRYQWCYRCI